MRVATRLTAAAVLLVLACVAHAGLRSPQVVVSGTALQNFFTAQGQAINVNSDQLDQQTFSAPFTTAFSVQTMLGTGNVGTYNAGAVSPALYLVDAGSSPAGWFATASYRTSPQRLAVNLFDNTSAFVGSTTYLSGPPDPTSFGFYGQDANTSFSQDARNTAGARVLAFAGTGARSGSTWLAIETSPTPGGDYADVVALVGLAPAAPVPATTTTWSRVKRLFQ
jgi:hypothetical protein